MGFSAALPGGAISGADAVPRAPGGAGGAAATRARRFRWAAGRARSLRRALRRCGAARCASPARAWGAFSGRRVVWWELSVAPGRTARGGGGFWERWAAPRVFYAVSLSSRPVAVVWRPDRSVARRRRAFHRAALGALPSALLSGTLAIGTGCVLRVDLDLTGLQRLRRRKEPLQLKRCRALSSAHDIHILLHLSTAPQPWRAPSSCLPAPPRR